MVTEKLSVYRCGVCGNMVEVVRVGGGTLVCCDQPMNLLTANTTDAAKEKHVPVVQQTAGGVKVTVGAIVHPMEEKHFIEWIEVLVDGKSCRQFLDPGNAPEAVFAAPGGRVVARAFCNLHGLWENT